jgi:hypothetical protein
MIGIHKGYCDFESVQLHLPTSSASSKAEGKNVDHSTNAGDREISNPITETGKVLCRAQGLGCACCR